MTRPHGCSMRRLCQDLEKKWHYNYTDCITYLHKTQHNPRNVLMGLMLSRLQFLLINTKKNIHIRRSCFSGTMWPSDCELSLRMICKNQSFRIRRNQTQMFCAVFRLCSICPCRLAVLRSTGLDLHGLRADSVRRRAIWDVEVRGYISSMRCSKTAFLLQLYDVNNHKAEVNGGYKNDSLLNLMVLHRIINSRDIS